MTAENVIVPEAFKPRMDKEKLTALEESGAVSSNPLPIDKLELPEVGFGDHVLGTLTDEEAELFTGYYDAAQELDDLGREVGANFFANAADAIRNKTEEKAFSGGMQLTDEEASKIFKLQRKVEYLKSLFYWYMCEKYNCHEYKVGVRSRRRFVKNKKMY